MIDVLKKYPSALLQHGFCSPFLHHSLYEENVADMATLAKSAMAVCFGSALETADGARFARQAMTLERQRIIEAFPASECMQQWDLLHAMLLYEVLGIRIASESVKAPWKLTSYSKSMQAPFLVKMARGFIHSHLHAPGSTLMAAPGLETQDLAGWSVAETARRTIFLANAIHFLSSIDPNTGHTSPYYEPLNDELVLNLPLPCSHALWSARTEQEWQGTEEYSQCQGNDLQAPEDFATAFYVRPGGQTLNGLLTRFPKQYLDTFLLGPGFNGSDELRSFVIRCALYQFHHK
ncbi:hypothetical protein N7470_005559 [Penicillium chermesinum]|nr:hypothetical protein N7470_005559 [Penicillium chermesinum]